MRVCVERRDDRKVNGMTRRRTRVLQYLYSGDFAPDTSGIITNSLGVPTRVRQRRNALGSLL